MFSLAQEKKKILKFPDEREQECKRKQEFPCHFQRDISERFRCPRLTACNKRICGRRGEGRFVLSEHSNRSRSVNKVQRLQAIYKRAAKDEIRE